MKALVYKEPYAVAVEDVDDPKIEDPTDAIIKITTSAICGSDLHMYEGRTGAEAGIVFGHENLGVVEEVGPGVGKLEKGDRIVLPFNVACGFCRNCEAGKTGGSTCRPTPVRRTRTPLKGRLLFEIGKFFEKGQTMGTGQADVKRYNRQLRDPIVAGRAEPGLIVSKELPLAEAPDAYQQFDDREEGCSKVLLHP